MLQLGKVGKEKKGIKGGLLVGKLGGGGGGGGRRRKRRKARLPGPEIPKVGCSAGQ